MSFNKLKKKKSLIIFSDGSFLITSNIFFQKIKFFEKDERNCTFWLKTINLQNTINTLNYKSKFLK